MPADDLIINVRQINGYPFQPNAGYGDDLLLQTNGGGPYYTMSAQGLVASALVVDPNRGMGVGAALPFGAGGNILAANGFVAPLDAGILFNCYASNGDFSTGSLRPAGLTYLAPGPAGQVLFAEEGWAFLGAAPGDSLTPVLGWTAAATLTRAGQLAVRQQITVGRDPMSQNEVVTFGYMWANTITRNPGNGKLSMTAQDIMDAGGATHVNAALAGYPTAQTPVPEAHGPEIATAEWVRAWGADLSSVVSWNSRRGEVKLDLFDILSVGGAPQFDPQFVGQPRAPTPPSGDSSTLIATTAFVTTAINNALGVK